MLSHYPDFGSLILSAQIYNGKLYAFQIERIAQSTYLKIKETSFTISLT